MANTDMKLLGVEEVAELIGVSRSYAYRIIRKLNDELVESGNYIVPGKVNKAYLEQKYFGIPGSDATEKEVK